MGAGFFGGAERASLGCWGVDAEGSAENREAGVCGVEPVGVCCRRAGRDGKGLEVKEIMAAMATVAYVDLGVDVRLWRLENRGRNRRLAFAAALVLGSVVGACLIKAMV